jgi:3-hydroxyacyl-[acyl-carrier-protein] dehydratase
MGRLTSGRGSACADPLVVLPLELEQDRREKACTVDGLTELHEQRGRWPVDVRRQVFGRDVDVDPHAEHHAILAGLGEDPGQLSPVYEQIVRQLDLRQQPGGPADAVRRGCTGDDRQCGEALRLDGRSQVDGEEEARARRGKPRPAEATPPRRLLAGRDDGAFRCISRQLALGRLASLEIAVRTPETPLEQRLDALREQRVPTGAPITRLISHVASLTKEEIEAILPHRDPFLLLDEIVDLRPGEKVVARKRVRPDEWYLAGHFPGRPIMPGVLIVEAMAQAGAVAVLSEEENRGKLALFAGIDGVRFKRVVEPGDELELTCELERVRGPIGRGKATATVDGSLAARGTLTFAVEQ